MTAPEYPVGRREGARITGVSLPTFDREVAAGRYPKPFYPSPRLPRWWPSELRAAVEAMRALPVEQKETRRQRRLKREAATADPETLPAA